MDTPTRKKPNSPPVPPPRRIIRKYAGGSATAEALMLNLFRAHWNGA